MKCFKDYSPRDMIILLLIIGVISLGVISILRERIVNPNQERLVVSAEGKVFAKPDIANISFGFNTDIKLEAKDAVIEGTEKMNDIIAKLKKIGIEEKDIKTTAYNLNPVYAYPKETGERKLSGYELSQQIGVKIRDLEKIGEVVREATNAGANQSGGINFTIDDPEELKAEARADAIQRAKIKAKQIAKESGIKIGKIVNVSEYDSYIPSYRNDFAYSGVGGEMVKMEAIPDIESGEMEIRVSVNLTYKVK